MTCAVEFQVIILGKCFILPSLYAVLIEAYCLLSGSFIKITWNSTAHVMAFILGSRLEGWLFVLLILVELLLVTVYAFSS
jgi:hypothetical protein